MAESRKLAAILAADVVGYSRLTSADEDRTLARLRALRSDLIDPTIAVHHGRVVKRTASPRWLTGSTLGRRTARGRGGGGWRVREPRRAADQSKLRKIFRQCRKRLPSSRRRFSSG